MAALGTLKNTSVLSPLFPAFGPEPIRERLRLGDAKVLVTSPELYQRKIAPIRATLPALAHVLIVGEPPDDTTIGLAGALAASSDEFEIPPTDPEDMALLHFTSGTTGKPKGAVHVHQAVVAHHATAAFALDLRPGRRVLVHRRPRLGHRHLLRDHRAAHPRPDHGDRCGRIRRPPLVPAARRAQGHRLVHGADRAADADALRARAAPPAHDLSALRFIASVGEPLNPEAVVWGQEALGLPIHDNWWQTETGAIMISNFASMDIRPGSMGRPLPGVTAGLLERGADGRAQGDRRPGHR